MNGCFRSQLGSGTAMSFQNFEFFEFQEQACHSAGARERPRGRPDKQAPRGRPSKPARRGLFPKWTGPALAIAFFLSMAALRAAKAWLSFSGKAGRPSAANFREPGRSASEASRGGAVRDISLPPFLVSLKGARGLQLARIHAEIKIRGPAAKKELLSDRKKLSKYFLFALSGQSAAAIAEKTPGFERQIQSQLNSFLSKGSLGRAAVRAVEKVSIRAKEL